MNELQQIATDLRRLIEWDQENGALGYANLQNTEVSLSVPQEAPPLTPSSAPQLQPSTGIRTLEEIRAELGDCTRCKLCDQGRKAIVFGEGNPSADVLFAGEGPGYHEDRLGRPFVGPAGELLDKMIGAMGLAREDTYICNVVKCRPPKNRDPEPDEVDACHPFLKAQVESVKPKVIVALGRFAAQTLLDTSEGISRLRGRFHPCFWTKLMPTFHPAYLLRNPAGKRQVWEDLQQVIAELKKA